MKYNGTIDGLQKRTLDCNVFGDWCWHGKGRFYQFRSMSGEIMNWWPTTKTIFFQGKPGPLQRRFTAVFAH